MSGLRWTPEQYELHQRKTAALAQAPAHPVAATPAGERKETRYRSKAEARYADILEAERLAGRIRSWRHEAITLKLADGVRYTPDFLVVDEDGRMALLEVKGYMREAARIRLLVATEQYPLFRWRLAWARRDGQFKIEGPEDWK